MQVKGVFLPFFKLIYLPCHQAVENSGMSGDGGGCFWLPLSIRLKFLRGMSNHVSCVVLEESEDSEDRISLNNVPDSIHYM